MQGAWRDAYPGFASFNGDKIAELRKSGEKSIFNHKGIIENEMIFYVPKIKIPEKIGKWLGFIQFIRINFPLQKEKFQRALNIPEIDIRIATIHKNSWGLVLNGSIVISPNNDLSVIDDIRKHRKRIVNRAFSSAKNQSKKILIKHLPLGYARLLVFRKDYRKRRLNSFGLGCDLICCITFQKLSKIKCPDLYESEVEASGKWRIAWNKAWLEDFSRVVKEKSEIGPQGNK